MMRVVSYNGSCPVQKSSWLDAVFVVTGRFLTHCRSRTSSVAGVGHNSLPQRKERETLQTRYKITISPAEPVD